MIITRRSKKCAGYPQGQKPANQGFPYIGILLQILSFKKLSRHTCASQIPLLDAPSPATNRLYHDAVVAELVDAQR
jgi:hypothetical protein